MIDPNFTHLLTLNRLAAIPTLASHAVLRAVEVRSQVDPVAAVVGAADGGDGGYGGVVGGPTTVLKSVVSPAGALPGNRGDRSGSESWTARRRLGCGRGEERSRYGGGAAAGADCPMEARADKGFTLVVWQTGQ